MFSSSLAVETCLALSYSKKKKNKDKTSLCVFDNYLYDIYSILFLHYDLYYRMAPHFREPKSRQFGCAINFTGQGSLIATPGSTTLVGHLGQWLEKKKSKFAISSTPRAGRPCVPMASVVDVI